MKGIEEKLRGFYAKDAAFVDPAKKQQVIELVAREAQKASCAQATKAISFWKFALIQMRFINPVCWIFQIALVACVLIAGNAYRAPEIQAPLIMTFAMLTVAIAIPSVFKSLESRTVELELACRFNSTQVLASRLIIFGLADVLWFSIVIAIMPSFAASEPFSVFLYASTPFFLFCALCFYLARVANKHAVRVAIAAVIISIVALWQLMGLLPHWYSNLSWATWTAALIFAIALAAFELRRLISDMSFVIAPSHAHFA